MSDEIGTYTFIPWLKRGISNQVQTADFDPSVRVRATVNLTLDIIGEAVAGGTVSSSISRDVELYGPGDIIGIESRAIIKTEPENWITNFEPNYLPYIEFYDEDFPWRYTPVAPGGNRMRPWITLVVLGEDEFSDGANMRGRPLPFINIDDPANVLPKAEELWAWCHVHNNKNLVGEDIVSTDNASMLSDFESMLGTNPDLAYSRILCPRKLAPNTRYHAFLIPTFESGRLAGIGVDPTDVLGDETNGVHATFSAWADYTGRQTPGEFPVYFRWFFRTGARGDFEYLVRLLEPRPADKSVGRRDMDVQNPGSNIAGITDPELNGILKLGGALQVPFDTLEPEDKIELAVFEDWDQNYPHPFQTDLSKFLNLADDYAILSAEAANQGSGLADEITNDPDPLITPPIYGKWHALEKRLLKNADGTDISPNRNWLHQLNLDPRWRAVAGFGTEVVQKNQEQYMDDAWGQLGDVLEANRRIRQAQLAKQVSRYWYQRHIKPLDAISVEKTMLMTSSLQKRVLHNNVTLHHQTRSSRIPGAMVSAPFRRVVRPRSRITRKLTPELASPATFNLLDRTNLGEIKPAPDKTVPKELPTTDDLADDLLQSDANDGLSSLIRNYPWLRFVPFAVALLLFIILLFSGFGIIALVAGVGLFAIAFWAFRYLGSLLDKVNAIDSIRDENQTPESVDALLASPDFEITDPVVWTQHIPATEVSLGGSDNAESIRFKTALKDAYNVVQVSLAEGRPAVRTSINLRAASVSTLNAINPEVSIPKYIWGAIAIPPAILDLIGESFVEAMAYPEFDYPMYKPLEQMSTELFVPNLNKVEPNSITLLETNQKFIESYMVGLNHEFARELLWREYFTDQRGSYFRQFWDVSSFLDEEKEQEELREELKDIPPIHTWSKHSDLDDHDHREQGMDNEEELVLVIRGELLKKYPNAVIYAHKAKWQPKSETDSTIDKTKERRFDEAVAIKTPLYEAKVDPDIYFFGFDLTALEARGDDNVDDDPGWFFVIKERPGVPRFGLDIEREGPIQVWNDLSWNDAVPGYTDGDFIEIAGTSTLVVSEPTSTQDAEKHPQWEEDKALRWHSGTHSAELAYILYQAPVLMGVHASEMLPDN